MFQILILLICLLQTNIFKLEQTGLKGNPAKIITDVMTLEDCLAKSINDPKFKVTEFKADEQKCEIHQDYNYQ